MSTRSRRFKLIFWRRIAPVVGILGAVVIAFVIVKFVARSKYRDTAAHSIDRARLALERRDIPAARERFSEALERDPENKEAASALARLKLIEGNLPGCLDDLTVLARRFPEDFDTHLLLASVGLHLGEVAKALPAARTAVMIKEDSVGAHLLLARALARSDAPEEATEHFRSALALDGSLVRPCFELANAARTATMRSRGWKGLRPERAIQMGVDRARALIEADPDDAGPRQLLVRFLSALPSRTPAQVVPEALLLLKTSGGDPVSHLVAIRALWSVGDWERASVVLENAERFFPHDPRFALVRAELTGRMGYSSAALEVLEASIGRLESAGRTGPLHLARAGLALGEGRVKDAYEEFAAAEAAGAPTAVTVVGRIRSRVEECMRRWEMSQPPPPDVADLEKQIEELLRMNPRDRATLRLAGRLRLATGRVMAASDALLPVTARGTQKRDDLYYLGLARLALGDARQAVPLIETALRGRPAPLHRLVRLAGAYLARGDVSAAGRVLDGLSGDAPRTAEVLLLRARIAAAGKEDPLPFLEKAYTAKKEPAVALRIALLRAELGEADADRILVDLVKEQDDDPARLALVRYRLRTGAKEQALVLLNQMTDSPEAQLERTECLLALGRIGEAQAALKGVSGPRNGRARYLEGTLLLAEQRPADAVAAFESALARAGPREAATLGLARALLATGKVDRAGELAQSLIGKAPWDGPAKEVLAEAAISMAGRRLSTGDSDEAMRLLGEAAEASGGSLADMMLAEVLDRSGDSDAAARCLAAAEEKAPRTAEDHARLAAFRMALGNADGALQAAAAAREAGAEDPRLSRIEGLAHLRCGRPGFALAAFRSATEESPRDPIARSGIVASLVALEKLEDAEAAAGEACAAIPGSAPLRVLHGDVLRRMKRDDDAASSWKKALDADPSSIPAATRLVSNDLRHKRPDDALTLLGKLAKKNRESAPHWILLARLQDQLGKPEDATDSLQRAAAAAPEFARPVALLADRMIRQRDLRARDLLQGAVDHHPDHPGLLTMLGVAHEQRVEPEPAAAAYERALAIRPGLVLAANNLALILVESADSRDRAAALARTAVENSNGAPFATHTLGSVLRAAGHTEEAVPHLRDAAEKQPKSATYAFDLGAALLDHGEEKAGRDELFRALRLGLDKQHEAEAMRLLEK